ncbi:MAG TPA: outer membrane beta-barrel protein [Chitinophagaceae bacterium]|jgi:hypothetical protein|nr:outer membrane beta-barrel protein [Chitinophagaceae bacterium]
MRRIVFAALILCLASTSFAQTDSSVKKTVLSPAGVGRSSDHLMLQLGYTTWLNKPDSINTGGLPRTVNIYFLFDFPFKTNPKWSAAIGAGIGSDNMFFEDTYIGLKENTGTLRFQDLSDTNAFKKYKLNTTFVEIPVELRFQSNPAEPKRSVKFALGAKVGTMLSATVKGKNFQNKNDQTLINYTLKEKSKRYFNTNRLSLTGRIGYGNFSLFGSWSATPLIKEGLGPAIRPLTIGLTLSGL